jgi:hypothetical protein
MTLVTDRMRAQIGSESRPYSMLMEPGDMTRFSTMLRTGWPWPRDSDQQQIGKDDVIVAAPTYLIVMRPLEAAAFGELDSETSSMRGVDGGSEWSFLEPIRSGDVITGTIRVEDYMERETSLGPTLFQILDITYRNQHGRVVVRQRDTRIYYP